MGKNSPLSERELLERLSVATQAAGIFVWEFDWATNSISWDENRLGGAASKRHFGFELGEDLFQWVHPDDRDIGHRTMSEALARGDNDASFDYRLRLADGSIRHIRAFARTNVDDRGRPLRSIGVSWDITREVEAAEQLKRIAEKERKLLEHLNIAALAAGIACWEFDYAREEFSWFHRPDGDAAAQNVDPRRIGAQLMAAVLPEDAAMARETTARAIAAGEKHMSIRIRARGPDGALRHVQLYQRFLRDADGRAVRAVGASRDVTVEIETAERFREQAEALHDAQRRLERASLSIHEGHWELDLLTQKHWCSSSYRSLLGYAADELDLETLDEVNALIHPEDLPHVREASEAHIESGAPYSHELRMRLKDGSYRWFQVRGVAERDAQGRAIRLSGSIQDIHKHRLVEDELKIARQRFERAIRGTQDGLWEWDLLQQVFWVSPRFETILDYGEGEVSQLARTPNDLVHPEDLPVCESAQREHFRSNGPYDVEVRMRTRGGAYRWIRMRGEADRNGAGVPMRLAGSIQDVTEARAARDALIRASEAAQAANRSKSAFLANVSHEIRTPMNGILGMTSLLLDTQLDAAQREYAQTIRASAGSLLAVINDILDFSKIEAGRLDIESVEMSVRQCVAEVRAMLGFEAEAKGLRLAVAIRPGVPERVVGDPQRIRQCLVNLVGNALKFTSSGDVVVDVSVSGAETAQPAVRFEVRDTGIGIAPEAISKLFQPFVQADSSTTRHFGGTGLGLSIVRRLVEMMGGRIGVDSRIGKGSTFWFELPMPIVAAVAEPAPAPAAEPPAAGVPAAAAEPAAAAALTCTYRGRVLLVEDNPVNQRVARSFLERMGCSVDVAVNGLDALQRCTQRRFDLVLLDLQMPLMDGYSATSCLRKLEHGRRRTPIVALTASAMSGQRERCLQAGMDELIPKPLDLARLQEVLDRFGLRGGAGPEAASGAGPEPWLDDGAALNLIATPGAAAGVDFEALAATTGGDGEFERELVQIFIHASEELLARIGGCAARGERARLQGEAHSLKGASANIHAPALREICATLEARAGDCSERELIEQVARLAAEHGRVAAALQQHLRRAPAAADAAAVPPHDRRGANFRR